MRTKTGIAMRGADTTIAHSSTELGSSQLSYLREKAAHRTKAKAAKSKPTRMARFQLRGRDRTRLRRAESMRKSLTSAMETCNCRSMKCCDGQVCPLNRACPQAASSCNKPFRESPTACEQF